VLLVGGLVALAAALGVGWVYADRALVPIRDALRRQREFAADASHELRTPLAILRGSIDHLRRNADRPVREVGTALDDLDAEVDRLGGLVDDLLLLARTDSGDLELTPAPLDLADVAVDAAAGLAAVGAERGVRVVLDATPVELVGDAGRLRQLVRILVDNAIAWSPPNGMVVVGVREEGSVAVLTVEDEGPGIRQADLPRIFDRFWRAADAPPGGNGLGLTIAAWIADRNNGRIRDANRPAGGARLEVRLARA
jgi:two-component system sensor histidine kinase CiaH